MRNTGDCNTGYCNTGNWNTGDCNTGFFNTTTPEKIRVFNKDVELYKWKNIEKPNFLYFGLTSWVDESEMSEKEKNEFPEYHTLGGYLKKYDYKEAFRNSYYALTDEERKIQTEQLVNLPNFDKDIFFEISGIDIDLDKDKKEMTVEELEKELGYKIKIVGKDER